MPAGAGRQGDAAAHRQAFDQHLPALTGHLLAADQVAERDEDILAEDRTIHERRADRVVTTADVHAVGVARNQGTGDADVFHVTQQVLGVEHAEGQADHGGDRCQGDPALLEVQADADDFLALMHAATHDAGVRDGGRVTAGTRAGQAETRNLATIGQTRQVVVLLFFAAVLEQQLARAEGVGHADGDHQRLVDRQLLQHQ